MSEENAIILTRTFYGDGYTDEQFQSVKEKLLKIMYQDKELGTEFASLITSLDVVDTPAVDFLRQVIKRLIDGSYNGVHGKVAWQIKLLCK